MLRSVFLNGRNVICFAKLKAVTGSSIEDILQELNTSPFYLCMVEIIELMWADLFTENVKFARFLWWLKLNSSPLRAEYGFPFLTRLRYSVKQIHWYPSFIFI